MNDDKYDYYEAVREDVRQYLEDNCDGRIDDPCDVYDEMFISDSVTGNASGSYYCSTWKAESALCHNSDLLEEAEEEFGASEKRDPETLDVVIRCYVLGQVYQQVVDEWNEKFPDDDDDE